MSSAYGHDSMKADLPSGLKNTYETSSSNFRYACVLTTGVRYALSPARKHEV